MEKTIKNNRYKFNTKTLYIYQNYKRQSTGKSSDLIGDLSKLNETDLDTTLLIDLCFVLRKTATPDLTFEEFIESVEIGDILNTEFITEIVNLITSQMGDAAAAGK